MMITVIGSINMDLVVGTERFPKQGETVLGNLYTTVPGGKGANQAVAAARLGDQVHIVGAVGSDAFGTQLLEGLETEQIDTRGVKKTDGASGVANILLSEGDNRIIVVPGANHELTKSDIDAQKNGDRKKFDGHSAVGTADSGRRIYAAACQTTRRAGYFESSASWRVHGGDETSGFFDAE